ncbi:hypothetical protein [Hydrogenimonas cancrithermarum]|uniref:Highly acidic protein n=1 Tax=Hydrogenimonas cancrithermarum TaxID=2993563 RepID=A0ABM8FLZ3_9BACT|nr:hypothetical protein [Hydrogenimonas cancrithermarum]BDY12725.1 hypothetical protein HCR_10370 [Hydrogenimonas cancrithermarum]
MRMLLINQNPVVSKLAGLSAQKSGIDIVEKSSIEEMGNDTFDLLFIDDARLEGMSPEELKAASGTRKACLIYADDDAKIPGFDYYIKKPFLPTEMVDLLSEIKDDLLLPEMEESVGHPEEKVTEESSTTPEAQENFEDFESLLEEIDMEESEPRSEEEMEAAKGEEEDFEALLQSMEEDNEAVLEEESGSVVEEAAAERETATEEAVREAEEISEDEEIDFESLLEEMDVEEREFPSDENLPETAEAEEIETLHEEIDLEEGEEEPAEEEPISLPEPEEPLSGVLDEELVSEVKELLEEGSEPEEEVTEDFEALPEEALAEEGRKPMESTQSAAEPEEKEAEVEAEAAEEEMDAGFYEEFEAIAAAEETPEDELDLVSEEELGAVLGETFLPEGTSTPGENAKMTAKEADMRSQSEETALISKLLGMDPEALRKLLAGAQINITITFPKES